MQNANNDLKKIDFQKMLQAKNTMAGDLFGAALNTELFPVDRLSCSWKTYAHQALMKSAPMSHRLSLKEFAEVVKVDPFKELTLFQFGVLSNSLETISPHALDLIPEAYYDFIQEAVSHIEWYQNRVSEIRQGIEARVEQEFQMKGALEKPLLKPVIGQA
jgi:hypothetical protein